MYKIQNIKKEIIMKSFKRLLWTMAVSVVSSGIVAMEYQPKIYIKNHNVYSKVRSGGILCKINGEQQLIFVPMDSDETLLGQAGDIRELVLQPSTSGTGKSGYFFAPENFSVTKQLEAILSERGDHPNEDILIFVENRNSMTGAWSINMRWIDRRAEAMPIGRVRSDALTSKLKAAYEEWKKTHGDDSSSEESW
jgi:hypothetical protein